MNDTQEAPAAPGPDDAFDAGRLRTISDMRRSSDDRFLGGVCSGAARYLNIDPVIVRVAIAALSFVGFAGVILYVAAWFLLPSDDSDRSIAADWLRLSKNEEPFRKLGLVAAGVVAAISVVGDNGFASWGAPWFLIPLAGLYYLFVVRPRRRRDPEGTTAWTEGVDTRAQAAGAASGDLARDAAVAMTVPLSSRPRKVRKARARRSWALTVLTGSITLIAVAATRIYADFHDAVPWTTYVVIALGIVAIGLLVGTVFGHGGPLVLVGIVLVVALAIGSPMPASSFGQQQVAPVTASQVAAEYTHGAGLLELDLRGVADVDTLLGRTVVLRSGVGQLTVIVPAGINIEVDAHLDAGEIRVFNRDVNGFDIQLDTRSGSGAPALTLEIHQRIGDVEVVRS